MSEEFEKTINLCLIYSKDLRWMLAKICKNDKLDGLLIPSNNSVPQVMMSQVVKKEVGLEIEPSKWGMVTALQHIEKKWKIDVYVTISEIETINQENFTLISLWDLPDNIHPNLKWLIPLSLDFTMHGSSFNQILMK